MKAVDFKSWLWQFAKAMSYIWLPIVLFLAAILWLFYNTEKQAQWTVVKSEEQVAVNLADQAISIELAIFSGDALYLAKHSALHYWLETNKTDARKHVIDELLAFTQRHPFYDQVRVLDTQGREKARINWNNGNPVAVDESELQDKSHRYYFQQVRKVRDSMVYISPFDLNMEYGVIVQPIKPVIRVATPIVNRKGVKKGYIVLNYLGKSLLDRLQKINQQYSGKIWLLNESGYWLQGPRPEVEWNFMYPDRDAQFRKSYAKAWNEIKAGPSSGQLHLDDGLYTYSWVVPTDLHFDAIGERWLLVSYFSNEKFITNMSGYASVLVILFVALAFVVAVVVGFITFYQLQRQKSQQRVENSEARYRGLVDSAPDAIVVLDKDGRIRLANSQTERWFGYSRDELIGETAEKLIPERYHTQHVHDRVQYVKSPVVRPMGSERELYGLHKNGEEFPVEISLSPNEVDGELQVTTIIRDISARKAAEEAQRRIQARYQELVNNLPVGVYRKTPEPNGRFLEVNPAMVEMFEADSADQLLEHPVSDLYCDPSYRRVTSDKLMKQGRVQDEELKLKTLRGREFYGALTAVVKTDDKGNVYFDGIVEDITERKLNEQRIKNLNEKLWSRSTELESINKELESFSYSVSHDLRAPLRALDGFSHTLQTDYADLLDDRGKDRLSRMRAAAQRMSTLIDDLLNLSRVSRANVHNEPVDLDKIANDVIRDLRDGEPRRAVDVSVQPDLKTQGDPHLLRVVMDNLLGNAWKFTSKRNDAHIEVGERKNGDKVIYYVRDNGAGFDMRYANKLFGAFQRLHDVGEYQGTGIGLATVQRVINKHGGKIWAEAEVGKGATFYFSLHDRSDG